MTGARGPSTCRHRRCSHAAQPRIDSINKPKVRLHAYAVNRPLRNRNGKLVQTLVSQAQRSNARVVSSKATLIVLSTFPVAVARGARVLPASILNHFLRARRASHHPGALPAPGRRATPCALTGPITTGLLSYRTPPRRTAP